VVIDKYKNPGAPSMFDHVKTPSLTEMSGVGKPQTKAEHVKRITANEKLLGLTQKINKSSMQKVKIKHIESMNQTLQVSPSAKQPGVSSKLKAGMQGTSTSGWYGR